MVDINDRRNAIGSGDFNNPSGTFRMTPHNGSQMSDWSSLEASPQNRKAVHEHYRAQKNTDTWHEANRLAQRRAAHEARTQPHSNLASYAQSYQGHLTRVMGLKGRDLAQTYGELMHRQAGYGRT